MSAMDAPAIDRSSVKAWAASGAMALTGPADEPPLGPPAPLVPRLQAISERLARTSTSLGCSVSVDPLLLLGERAAIAGLRRNGQISCGGGTRLLRAKDGWLALSLARSDDVDLVPAWLGLPSPPAENDVWPVVTDVVRSRTVAGLVAQATVLGLPVGELPAEPAGPLDGEEATTLPGHVLRVAPQPPPTTSLDGVVVADLSSLWAGPLCGSLLSLARAHVIKVESTRRPDGARRGPTTFFDLLNAGKRSVAIDLSTESGRTTMRQLIEHVDVVIEASRPRALEQMGIHAQEILTTARPRLWVSITAHGRDRAAGNRVGFGDDAAVAGGLVAWHNGEPYFCADAVADPATGIVAATAALEALAAGGRWLLDIPLAGVARHLAGPTLPVPADVRASKPMARQSSGSGPELGAHTAEVLEQLGIRR